MKYLRRVVIFVVLFGLLVWGIDSYLTYDDLKKCDAIPSTKQGCQVADAIVAVSGGDTAARADEAIKLRQAGWAPIIIFSGAAKDKTGPSNALVMKQRAIDAGIEPNSIIIEENSETTEQNALETKSIFDSYQIKSVIVVTSPYHQRRASLEFQRRAIGVVVRSHPVAIDKQWNSWWWITPAGWALAVPELVVSFILSAGGVAR